MRADCSRAVSLVVSRVISVIREHTPHRDTTHAINGPENEEHFLTLRDCSHQHSRSFRKKNNLVKRRGGGRGQSGLSYEVQVGKTSPWRLGGGG